MFAVFYDTKTGRYEIVSAWEWYSPAYLDGISNLEAQFRADAPDDSTFFQTAEGARAYADALNS